MSLDPSQIPTPFSGQNNGWGAAGNPNQSFWKNPQFGGAAGDVASGLFNMFFAQDPSAAASQYLNQIPGMLQQYLGPYQQQGQQAYNNLLPYMQRGNTAGDTLMGQYGMLTSNPTGFMNRLGATYQQSPGYQWQVDQSLGAANRAAAAGGMAGSPQEQQQIAGVTNQLANQDYYNYLNHAIDLYGQGLSGFQNMYGQGAAVGQNIYDTSAQMTSDLANSLGAYYMTQGNNAYNGAINSNSMMGGGIGSLVSGLSTLATL